MNLFQWITVPLFVGLAIASAVATRRGRITRGLGIFWTLLSLGAATGIWDPDSTRVAAGVLGIGRGADLVFYFAIAGGAIAFFAVFVRLRSIEGQITELVRQMALASPIVPPAGDAARANAAAGDERARPPRAD